MKKLLKVVLSLAMCLLLSIPALAIPETVVSRLIPVNDINTQSVNVAENMASPNALNRALRDTASVTYFQVRPIVFCIEDQQAYILDITRTRTVSYGAYSQFGSLSLSPQQTTAYINQIFSTLEADSTLAGKTFALIGWNFITKIEVSSAKPKYIQWTPSDSCMEGTEMQQLNVPYTNAVITITHNYTLPKSDMTEYQNIGVNGGWYFTYASGKPGSTGINSSFCINSNYSNY